VRRLKTKQITAAVLPPRVTQAMADSQELFSEAIPKFTLESMIYENLGYDVGGYGAAAGAVRRSQNRLFAEAAGKKRARTNRLRSEGCAMNPNMRDLLEGARGKVIRISFGGHKEIKGELKGVFPEYLVVEVFMEASKGAPFSETTYVFVDHIRSISFPG
jgi:hypothetical protein